MKWITIILLLSLLSCKDERAVILEKHIKSIDTVYRYRVRTTEGEYSETLRSARLQVNDTISWGF